MTSDVNPPKPLKTLLDVLVARFPEMPHDKYTLVGEPHDLTNSPLDWAEFIMYMVAKNFGKLQENLIVLNDEETHLAMKIISKEQARVYIMNMDNQTVWDVAAMKSDRNERIFVGGDSLRKFCDAEKIFYRTTLTPDGKKMSASDCQYLANADDDCSRVMTKEEIDAERLKMKESISVN